MELNELKPPKDGVKRPKRIGRGIGSGHGKTATRGTKGQKARSGKKPRLGFEGGQMPLLRRIPKRGFRSLKSKFQIVNISSLNRFKEDSLITEESLYKAGLIKKKGLKVKILGKGKIETPLKIAIERMSKKALSKIEEAGGRIS